MRKKTKGDKDSQLYESDLEVVASFMKENGKKNIHESDWLELVRYGLRLEESKITKEKEKLKKDIREFYKAGDMKAFEESLMEFETFICTAYFILGEYGKIFEMLLSSSKVYHIHLTTSDCFYTYCWVSDSLVSFMLNNKEVTASHNVNIYLYDIERKRLDSVFNEFLKEYSTEKFENNVPVSETIELMIRKNKLLPNPDLQQKNTPQADRPLISLHGLN